MSSSVLYNETGKSKKVDILRNQHCVLVSNNAVFSHVNVPKPRREKKYPVASLWDKGSWGQSFLLPKKKDFRTLKHIPRKYEAIIGLLPII